MSAKVKTLPFKTEQLLKAVEDSSKRSRSILLLLTFTSFLTIMALVNSLKPKVNWFKSRTELNRDVIKYFVFPSEYLDKESQIHKYGEDLQPMRKISDYIVLNEKAYNHLQTDTLLNAFLIEMDRKYPVHPSFRIQNPKIIPVMYPSFEERKDKYHEIGQALNFIYIHQIVEKQTMINKISKYDDAEIEYLNLIRVPILGISFHSNYLGPYSGFLITILLVLFYFSLLREKINLKITFKRGWSDLKQHHYYLYEYASMQQVLSIPQKLFVPRRKKNYTYIIAYRISVFFPLLVFSFLFFYDCWTTDIGDETNSMLTKITITLSLFFWILILYYSFKVANQWKQMDRLWDDQSHGFNLEYILEAIGVDKEKELIELFKPTLSTTDLESVKRLWYLMLKEEKAGISQVSIRRATMLLANFINTTLSDDISNLDETIPINIIDQTWLPLVDWFNLNGKKNVSSNFRSSFCDTVNKILV